MSHSRLKINDDNLTLFNEMQSRESESFLLHSFDDFDESLTNFRCISDYKLTALACGESNDMLNADGDKNDYDWLLTPPDTPLFPSLDDDGDDDDETPSINFFQRGRPLSQPIAISRSTTMEKSLKSDRSSPSPHQLSPSSRSNNNTLHSRGRSSSTPHSSSPPALQPITPSRRPSPPPNKPSTPTMGLSTPTLHRINTRSDGPPSSSSRRGLSSGNASRRNSASPKLQAWQSSVSGFSAEVSLNLCTSLSDRPSSQVRGFSPVSNVKNSNSRHGRQSMSPTASRSANSSHGHERSHFESRSIGSMASSGNEDTNSLHSVAVGISGNTVVRKLSAFPSSRASSFSKKPSRIISSSVPKRSIDSAIHQMDIRKAPNMFRPLLSSVPPSTFYVGKTNTSHRPMHSNNSLHTTSTNASSEQGGRIAPNIEGSELDHDVLAGEWEKMSYSNAREEMFIFDILDEMDEDGGCHLSLGGHEAQTKNKEYNARMSDKVGLDNCEKHTSNHNDALIFAPTSSFSHASRDYLDVSFDEVIYLCSKCGKKFNVVGAMDGNIDVCQDCALIDELLVSSKKKNDELLIAESVGIARVVSEKDAVDSDVFYSKEKLQDTLQPELGVLELPISSLIDASLGQCERHIDQASNCSTDSSHFQMSVEKDQVIINDQLLAPRETSSAQTSQDNHHFNGYSSLKVDNAEGTGISIVLKDKWPVLQGRTFNTTTISYEDRSCARDSFMRNSLRQFSYASSSIDLSSSKNLEIQIQRQLSSRSSQSFKKEPLSKPKSIIPSLSRNSSKMSVDFEHIITMSMEHFDELSMKGEPVEEVLSTTTEGDDRALANEDLSNSNSSFTTITVKEVTLDHLANCSTNDTPTSELIKHVQIAGSKDLSTTECFRKEEHAFNPTSELIKHVQIAGQEDLSIIESLRNEDHASCINTDDFNHAKSSEEASADIVESAVSEEGTLMNNGVSGIDGSNVYTDCNLLENDCDRCVDSNVEHAVFSGLNNNMEASHEHYLSKDELISTSTSNICDSFHAIHESTVTIEGSGHKPRSITLEEATHAILFCSSIVHDLAYKAASIAMERESSTSLEAICLTVTTINKLIPNRKDNTRSNRSSNKRKKTRRKRLNTKTKTLPAEDKNDFKIQDPWMSKTEVLNRIDTAKPPKLESKCNCTVM